MHLQSQETEDAQINGCDDENATKLKGHRQSVFQKKYSTDFPQIGLHEIFRCLENESCCAMDWCVSINDTDFNLIENKTLTGLDLPSMLVFPHDYLAHSCNNRKLKCKCGIRFIFKLLPTLCAWRIQASVF